MGQLNFVSDYPNEQETWMTLGQEGREVRIIPHLSQLLLASLSVTSVTLIAARLIKTPVSLAW